MDAFKALALASEFPAPLTWQHEGLCRLQRADCSWNLAMQSEWNGSGQGDCDDPHRLVWFIPGGRLGQRTAGLSIAALDESWRTEHAFPRTTVASTTKLEWWAMWHRTSVASTSATVLLFERPGPVIFPHPLPVVDGVAGRSFR
jgi:hypothetical protein